MVKYLFESAERDFPTLNLHACQRIDSLKLPANTEEKPEETEQEKDKKSSSVSSFFLIRGNGPGPKIKLHHGPTLLCTFASPVQVALFYYSTSSNKDLLRHLGHQ